MEGKIYVKGWNLKFKIFLKFNLKSLNSNLNEKCKCESKCDWYSKPLETVGGITSTFSDYIK